MSETTSRKRASSEQEENTARKVPRNIGSGFILKININDLILTDSVFTYKNLLY